MCSACIEVKDSRTNQSIFLRADPGDGKLYFPPGIATTWVAVTTIPGGTVLRLGDPDSSVSLTLG